jgi:alginate O-acetyltransferase complex protein AlgI
MILASFVFYAWGEIRFIPVMFALSVEDFICAHMMERYRDDKKKRTIFMLISVCSNLGVLIYFKYTNFFLNNLFGLFGAKNPFPSIILPIGVSFNSFQSISYAIDVYRGTTSCEKTFYNYLSYTTLFPQIIAGPIVRYVTVENDLDDHLLTPESFSIGMRRFIIGLGKKVLIANNVGFLWSQVSESMAGQESVLLYWLGILAYTFQIYFDFSGYSDMAIGLARVFGLTFDENFNYPYISKSVTEFWRRCHITLGSWFRDYVYIPMGGNRCSVGKHIRNLFVVWALTGFWHGASWNFMFWGLFFAVILMIEKYGLLKLLDKLPKVLRFSYTMYFVMISWVIFYFEDLDKLGSYLAGMLGFGGLPLVTTEALYYLVNYALIFAIAAYASTPHFKNTVLAFTEKTKSKLAHVVTGVVYVAVFLLCVAYVVDSTYNPFLYFRF